VDGLQLQGPAPVGEGALGINLASTDGSLIVFTQGMPITTDGTTLVAVVCAQPHSTKVVTGTTSLHLVFKNPNEVSDKLVRNFSD
jgi:hypothetical protein